MGTFKVWTRWRPLKPSESSGGEVQRTSDSHFNKSKSCISVKSPLGRERSWKSGFSFDGVIEPDENNHEVYNRVVAPVIYSALQGKCCNFFAYGHSGSGKTHTMIGYDFEQDNAFGLCLAAGHRLMTELDQINEKDRDFRFGIGLRVYELRKNTACDLLNNRNECFIREGADRRVYVRGETEVLENGKVRVRPIATKACWTFEDLKKELQEGLQYRNTGLSTIHDQSSRTHAVIEMEIVTADLLNARNEVVERQSELVPVGKNATDVYIEEQSRALIQNQDGKYIPNPEYQINQERVDDAETKKTEYELRVQQAEQHEREILAIAARAHPCSGGRLVFVDLAGAEFLFGANGTKDNAAELKQTPQEKQQGRQINTDLLALKEVIRARSLAQPRIPYRSSPLTMVLREHFEASEDAYSSMILTVSPGVDQYAATMNTLKYGDLVGLPNVRKEY